MVFIKGLLKFLIFIGLIGGGFLGWRMWKHSKGELNSIPGSGVLTMQGAAQGMDLEGCPNSPNCVSSQAEDESHYIEPLTFRPGDFDPMHRLQTLANSLPGAKLIEGTQSYLRFEFTSKLFKFVDDVEFLKTGNQIQIRSASRVGYSDLGANRKRIERIRSLWAVH